MKTTIAILALSLVTGVTSTGAKAEVTIKGIPCSEYAQKAVSKYARCADELPKELRETFMKQMAAPIAATAVLISAVKNNDPNSKELCEAFAEGFEGDGAMDLDAPGCD